MLLGATLLATLAASVPAVPGIVILEPGAGPSSQGRVIAARLAAAEYATLIATGNPLAAAATLRHGPGVRADDIALVGFGEGASSVLATIVEPYDLDVAQPPVFRSAVALSPDCARRYGDWTGSMPLRASGTAGAPHGGGPESGLFRSATPLLKRAIHTSTSISWTARTATHSDRLRRLSLKMRSIPRSRFRRLSTARR